MRRVRPIVVAAAAAAIFAGVVGALQRASNGFDVLIKNGRIVDGTGAPWFRGDVGITGDRIVAVGSLSDRPAAATVDATDLVVAPGFIDLLGQSEFHVLVDGRAASKILQGVTTEVTGEGRSIAPVNDRLIEEARPSAQHFGVAQNWRTLSDYFKRLEERSHPAINVGTLVGAGGLRNYVIGKDDRPATAAELDQMKQLVTQAMEHGALGLSTSLQYVPDRFASTDEIVELAKVAAKYGGVYFTHQRSESGRIFESVDEVIAISRQAGIPAEIWHLKTAYKSNWGKMPEVLRRLEQARAGGVDVTANQYPYPRASNGLDACLPLWVREGGLDKMLARLRDPAQRERIKREMEDPDVTGGKPMVRLGWRRWRDVVIGAQSGVAQIRRPDLDPDRQSHGKGPAGCRHGSGHRRAWREFRHHFHHERRGRAHRVATSARRHWNRLWRAGRRWQAVGVEVASARVGLVPADSRQV